MTTRMLAYTGLAAAAGMTAMAILGGPPKVKKGSRVFLVGDSLAEGLSRPLSAFARDSGVAFETMARSGTRIDQWANNEDLFRKLRAFRPTHILVSLGTNDEYLKLDAGKRQAPYLETLLERLRRIAPVVWIGPPKLPKAASNGAIPLILREVPSSHYFPSQELMIPQGGDKLHPTVVGYALWAGHIWRRLT